MITADLANITLQEHWCEAKSSIWFKMALPLQKESGGIQCTLVYFELEPDYETGLHKDSAEKLIFVMDGTLEARIGMEKRQIWRNQMAIVPAAAPHTIRNIGSKRAKCLSYFASAGVVSSFEKPLNPSGERQLHFGLLPV